MSESNLDAGKAYARAADLNQRVAAGSQRGDAIMRTSRSTNGQRPRYAGAPDAA